jgi:hypothetical protein
MQRDGRVWIVGGKYATPNCKSRLASAGAGTEGSYLQTANSLPRSSKE